MGRRSKFTPSEILKILAESRIHGVARTARRYGISDQTIRRWRQKYEGLSSDQAKRLKQLEEENRLLRQMVVDRDMKITVLEALLEVLEKEGFFGSRSSGSTLPEK